MMKKTWRGIEKIKHAHEKEPVCADDPLYGAIEYRGYVIGFDGIDIGSWHRIMVKMTFTIDSKCIIMRHE